MSRKQNVVEINETPKSKRPISERQRAANHANGAKSHGPKTAEGRAISCQNAAKHRLTASLITLEGEDLEDYERFRDALSARLDPRDAMERDLCEKMAYASWRITRAALMEAELLDIEIENQLDDAEDQTAYRPATAVANAYEALTNANKSLSNLNRYEASLARQYALFYKMFNDLRKRNDLPPAPVIELPQQNEPIPEIEHPQTIPISAPSEPSALPSDPLTTNHQPLTTS